MQAILWPADDFNPTDVEIVKYTTLSSIGVEEDLLVHDILIRDNPTIPQHRSALFVVDPNGQKHMFLLIHVYDQRLPLNNSVQSMTNGQAKWYGNIVMIQRAHNTTGERRYTHFPLTSPNMEAAKAGLTRYTSVSVRTQVRC